MRAISGEKRAASEKILQVFLNLYPNCFSLEHKKPLAIGIARVLAQKHPEFEYRLVKGALQIYTEALDYYGAFAACTHRVNLDGECAEELTEQNKLHASEFPARYAEALVQRERSVINRARNEAAFLANQAKKQANIEETQRIKELKKQKAQAQRAAQKQQEAAAQKAPVIKSKNPPKKEPVVTTKKTQEKEPVTIIVKKRPMLASLRRDKSEN